MADELIRRDIVLDIINTLKDTGEFAGYADYCTLFDTIDTMPAADVQPVKHGRWIPQGDDMWLCSNCKKNIIFSMHESDRTEKQRYCCRCGARMDGQEVEEDA